jgi:hypothetical protein
MLPVMGRLAWLAAVSTVLAGLNGILRLVNPEGIWKTYGIPCQDGKMGRFLQQMNGVVLVGHSLGLYLTLFTTLPPVKAIGISLLPRFLYLAAFCLSANKSDVGVEGNFLSINTLTMAWAVLSMTTGVGNPVMAATLFSTMALVKAAFLLDKPAEATKKFLGRDLTGTSFVTNASKLLRDYTIRVCLTNLLVLLPFLFQKIGQNCS